MKYEIHITVNCSDVVQFLHTCKLLEVKPTIVVLQNTLEGQERHVMTTSVYDGGSYEEELTRLVNALKELNYTIIRSKVEIQPSPYGPHKDHVYYESHLRCKFPIEMSVTEIQDVLSRILPLWHLSRNPLKMDDEYIYQMATYRAKAGRMASDFEFFNQVVELSKLALLISKITCDKSEVEECIFDSNTQLDSNWITRK